MKAWPAVPLGDVLVEQKERIGTPDADGLPLLGVSNKEGLHRSGMPRISDMSRYLRVKRHWFAYNPMRINVGSIGWAHCDDLVGVISPDYVVFSCSSGINPYLVYWYLTQSAGLRAVNSQTAGSVRDRLYFSSLANVKMPLPPPDKQLATVETVQKLLEGTKRLGALQAEVDKEIRLLLLGMYQAGLERSTLVPMSRLAPLVRRPVEIDPLGLYPELGVRSFGKGTFQKPALEGSSVGTKRLFRIEKGDLIFNIVFAWEGAVALVTGADCGRFGSHRFLTCVVDREIALPEFVRFHFLTEKGLEQLGQASPGGAGRNRTLGIDNLAKVLVPIPDLDTQRGFVNLLKCFEERQALRESIGVEVAALETSVLTLAFSGEF